MEHYFNNKNPNNKYSWKDEDKQFLKDNYHLMSIEELADYFDLPISRVKNQAQRQYLTKRGKS